MNSLTDTMSNIDHILSMTFRGETVALLGASMAGLGFLQIITPILAFIGAVIAIISGIYTLKVTRKKNRISDMEIDALEAAKADRESNA